MIRKSVLISLVFFAGCGGAEGSAEIPHSAANGQDDAGSGQIPEPKPAPDRQQVTATLKRVPAHAPPAPPCTPGLLREAQERRDWSQPNAEEQLLTNRIMGCDLSGFSKYVGQKETPNFQSSIGYRPLHLAIWQCDDAQVLLDGGADPNLPYDGRYPLELAIRYRKIIITKQLLSVGADLSRRNDWCRPLLIALAADIHDVKGGFHTVREVLPLLVAAGLDVNANGPEGDGILHLLLKQRAALEWFLQTLLDAGLDIDQRDADGNTPLILAASMGAFDEIEMLLKAGASTAATNREGKTALMKLSAYQAWGAYDCGPEETCAMALPASDRQEKLIRMLRNAETDPPSERRPKPVPEK